MTQTPWTIRKPLLLGLVGLGVLVFGFGYWSVQTTIAGAIIASGKTVVESNRQVIQHEEGGVVRSIFYRDSEEVDAGSVVIKLDDTLLASQLLIVENQIYEVRSRNARLRAERDGQQEVEFPQDLLEAAENNAELMGQIEGQARLFQARLEDYKKSIEQMNEQKLQSEAEINGALAQLKALSEQLDFVDEELKDQQGLLDKGLARATGVMSLAREKARLIGEVGRLEATIAQIRGRIAGLEIESLRLGSNRREEAITQLRDFETRAVELREQSLTLTERLNRLEVRTPVSGIVYGSQVFAEQTVIQAGEPLLYIIPQNLPMVISARVDAVHIDKVHVGQTAMLRFSAFDQRETPELEGRVDKVSADIFSDDTTGQQYYAVDLTLVAGELEKLGGQKLIPGMPVETFLRTAERSPLSYLMKPLTDYFKRALR